MLTVAMTGASGFVGSALLSCLRARGIATLLMPRINSGGAKWLMPAQDDFPLRHRWTAVVHLGARVHVLNDLAGDRLSAFREVNTLGTLNLARQAAAAGVNRFVFVSSIKVNGEGTEPDRAFRWSDTPNPLEPYGISKHEAEIGLREIAARTGMQVVIVRPPLVYGPGVKANFAAMMRVVRSGLPLPLASVTKNRRSFVALDNLVDLLVTCLEHPAAANQTFLVSDGEDLSTADLLRRLSAAMGRPARSFPLSPALLRAGAHLLGKGEVAHRLLDNLQVDITHTREALAWAPPITVDEGLRRAVAGLQTS